MSPRAPRKAGKPRTTGGVESDPTAGALLLDCEFLIERCASLATSVTKAGLVSKETVAEAKPGGTKNPDTSAMGWFAYHTQLIGWRALGPMRPAGTAAKQWDANLPEVYQALTNQPVFITFEADGERRGVYPVGEPAIRQFIHLDKALTYLAESRMQLDTVEYSDDVRRAIETCDELITTITGQIAWIATTPGAVLPWPEDGKPDHAPPEWTRRLTSADIIALRLAFIEVNVRRISAVLERMRQLTSSGDSAESITLSTFLGLVSSDFATNPSYLIKHYTLGELFAQAFTKVVQHEKQKQKTDRDKSMQSLFGGG